QQIYSWLLTCGSEPADKAYQQLFKILEFPNIEAPDIENIPETATAGFAKTYLKQFWLNAATKNFNSRLCQAAIIAWNYENNIANSNYEFSGWLTHLPEFQHIFDNLRVVPNYDNYLQRFGIEKFRSKQQEAINAILRGQRPLVLMATGGGKSLCYQLSALILSETKNALTVVVSPLQALMADQVNDLEKQGLDFATYINSNLSIPERALRLQQLKEGKKGLIYLSPEQLRSPSIRTLLQNKLPAFWVIDEAHCISEWGHNFRPDYRYLPKFIQELYQNYPMPLLALTTATATVKVQEDIKKLFAKHNLSLGCCIKELSIRQNLEYKVISVNGNKEQILIQEVKNYLQQEGSILVYTSTRKKAYELANLLNQNHLKAKYYHGKLSKVEKVEVLEEFKAGNLNIVVATSAFGMGINRQDVRAVIHHTISSNLESYIQETGRAGRDGKPATCILFFDEQDAETIFYLQSQMQLTEADLRKVFISARSIRDRLHGNSSEDWFWATTNEIYQTGDIDGEFASASEYRDIKIKVALQYLENFGLLERAENISAYIQFKLIENNSKTSEKNFEKYAREKKISPTQIKQFQKLVQAMHFLKDHQTEENELISLDHLSDESGITPKELTRRIQELQKAKICSAKIPLSFLITKSVKGDAMSNFHKIINWQEKLLDALLTIQGERQTIQINLRSLASYLDPHRSQKIRASYLIDILEGWKSTGWINLIKIAKDFVRIQNSDKLDKVVENLENHQNSAKATLEVLYEKLSDKKGTRLYLEYELDQLLQTLNQKIHPFTKSIDELSNILLWLHQRKLLRLTEGVNLFHQALKIKLSKGTRETRITKRYENIKNYYEEQNRRTHIMIQYGKIEDSQTRQKLVENYFNLSDQEFNHLYSNLTREKTKLPVIPDDYQRIIGDLNPIQKQIVLAEHPALLVIAGPGSGKTRTIVRRIAYLVKVKRVDPNQILVLAYNRNAVRELRLRLQELVGEIASRLRVYTFHGLALAILGCTFGQEIPSTDTEFKNLLEEACYLIAEGDELNDNDSQTRRLQLLGNVDYIFVDEYQDVAEEEYRLIQLISGLGDSGDESRSVQINLCVIGDDDQNLYEFRGTNPKYIKQFESEYKAQRFLLTENYRSTETIINAANHLISHNLNRCKQKIEEQVRINSARQNLTGISVNAYIFDNISSQAVWVTKTINSWICQEISLQDIAVLARNWDNLSPIRLLLETKKVPTYTLKSGDIKLVRNQITCQLIDSLKSQQNLVLSPQESVKDLFLRRFTNWHRSMTEPTVKKIFRIAEDLDLERRYNCGELALPITAIEIVLALLEFDKSQVFLKEDAVLVTSCHGAKGLEFRKVILLTDDFIIAPTEIESERRLFYVAMTRAKEELIFCSTNQSSFVEETDINSQIIPVDATEHIPQKMFYVDLTPKHLHIGHSPTLKQQEIIKNLHEGALLQMKVNNYGNSWAIFTEEGVEIGNLSKKGVTELVNKGIEIKQYEFLPGEVTVKSIFSHQKRDDMTGEIQESWFVVIPQIRVCRSVGI
ncbi:MAG: RecQ family ATP-dependent DNA helicase, partial [Microcoleaceae cyanobacterium]